MTYPKGKYKGTNHWNHGRTFGPKARKMMKTEAAWLAGLFDGEGTIFNSRRSTGGFNPRLAVGICNEEIILRIQLMTGCGSINLRKGRKANHSDCWVWVCNGANAISILKQIQPWLIVKREKAEEMIHTYTFTLDPS